MSSKIKVKFLGVPREFVGTEFLQDVSRGLCELKAPEYWMQAADKFSYLFKDGLKVRLNVLSISDEKVLSEEVSDQEYDEAKHLPYRELCGVISYPASCSKLEMRYCVSLCGRYRMKWGMKQFKVLMRAFEYGYSTRETGVIYSKGLDEHGSNVIYCFADSGHNVPRSQGCNITMMNGGCISLVTKKHTISAGSTCEDELIEFCNGVHKVCGFRNMSSEMGMHQDEPTVIYQDNEAAVQIELHRGSLSSRSKHMQLAVLRSRNKVEDQLVKPVFRRTTEMWADIGTKALPDKQFAYLHDKMNGYALIKKHHPSYMMPDYIT